MLLTIALIALAVAAFIWFNPFRHNGGGHSKHGRGHGHDRSSHGGRSGHGGCHRSI